MDDDEVVTDPPVARTVAVEAPWVTVNTADSVPVAPPEPADGPKVHVYEAPAYDVVDRLIDPPSHDLDPDAVIDGVGTLPPTVTVADAVAEQVAPLVISHERTTVFERPLFQSNTTDGLEAVRELNSTSNGPGDAPHVAPVALHAYVNAPGTGAVAPEAAVNVCAVVPSAQKGPAGTVIDTGLGV
jgi:hypothetical protein